MALMKAHTRQSIAAALSKKRQSMKMMAEGGEIKEMDDMDDTRSLGELNVEGESHPSEVMNPEEQEEQSMLAKALSKKAEESEYYAEGGEVEGEMDGMEGNMPDENMAMSTGEPMKDEPMKPEGQMGLSEKAKEALAMKKKNRRYIP